MRGRRGAARAPVRVLARTAAAAAPLALALALALAGCAVGDDYRRPALDWPASHRGAVAGGESLALHDWRAVYPEPTQQALIAAVLAGNLDLQTAEERIREARAGLVAARAGLLPTLGLGLTTTPTARRPGESLSSSFLAAGLLSWEIDLWGRVQRGAEAAAGELAAREAARDGARVSLIAETAARHAELTTLRELAAITAANVTLQANSLRLMQRRNEAGIVSSAEVRQAEGQLAATRARVPELQRQIAATEHALALLAGRPPGAIESPPATAALPDAALPVGMPAALLERRPDLREAEQRLVAANARVGEARALLLPSVSLTGALGRVGSALDGLLRSGGSAAVVSLGPNVAQSVYDGGALAANRDAALARLEQALLTYRRTALNALREVADALAAHDRAGEVLAEQTARAVAQRAALRLADRRFGAGVVSYLEVLDAQRQLLAAETDLASARLARLQARIQVYRALGGGWSAAGS